MRLAACGRYGPEVRILMSCPQDWAPRSGRLSDRLVCRSLSRLALDDTDRLRSGCFQPLSYVARTL